MVCFKFDLGFQIQNLFQMSFKPGKFRLQVGFYKAVCYTSTNICNATISGISFLTEGFIFSFPHTDDFDWMTAERTQEALRIVRVIAKASRWRLVALPSLCCDTENLVTVGLSLKLPSLNCNEKYTNFAWQASEKNQFWFLKFNNWAFQHIGAIWGKITFPLSDSIMQIGKVTC